ncbi:MAG: response regulator [Ignavibacteria bacterium]|nr:response regulator [Ignavibacteria bacterium]MBI3765474.1 response regulator [Ignavibacteriales bacterium]
MKTKLRVLHIEDSPRDVEIIQSKLEDHGFECEITRAQTEGEIVSVFSRRAFDVVFCDYSLPKYDGVSALNLVRKKDLDIPFIFVSGTIGEIRAIEALKGGATDYVRKDDLTRLVPSIRRALRESEERHKRKIAEEGLRKAEEKYRNIFENALEGIFQTSPDGKLIESNPAHVRMFGYDSREEILSTLQDVRHQLYVKPDQRFEIQRILDREGVIHGYEVQMYRKDRNKIWVSQSIRAVRDSKGALLYYEGLVTDITDRKKLEAQLLRTQRLESIGILAGGIAHDLNNVLAPIMMAVQVLKHHFKDGKMQQMLATLESSARRGADIVKQVLIFARGADGERGLLQPKHLIHEIENIVRETFPKSIELETHVENDLSLINGDSTQLHQVFLNLCVNARDAMPSGGMLTLEAKNASLDENFARFHSGAKAGPYVVFTVSDTGTGIPITITNKIFDPFFTTKEIGKGTGLGLSTALGIVKSHGGFIDMYSEIGKGTRFAIYLPSAESAQVSGVESKQEAVPLGQGELILVVDDEASIREIAKMTLEAHGYRVMLAQNGIDAITLFRQEQKDIDLVITDMAMPLLDGPSTIRELRKINPDVKIIGASGLTSGEDLMTSAVPNVDTFLSKPYTAEELLKSLGKILHR